MSSASASSATAGRRKRTPSADPAPHTGSPAPAHANRPVENEAEKISSAHNTENTLSSSVDQMNRLGRVRKRRLFTDAEDQRAAGDNAAAAPASQQVPAPAVETALAERVGRAARPAVERWAACEWFCSVVDGRALAALGGDFEAMLAQIGFADPLARYTRREWAQIRRRMGRPRRMSPRFLAAERARLRVARTAFVAAHAPQLARVFAPGSAVLALHPLSACVRPARVLSPPTTATIALEFFDSALGRALVPLYALAPIIATADEKVRLTLSPATARPRSSHGVSQSSMQTKAQTGPCYAPFTSAELKLLAQLLCLLGRKESYLNLLHQANLRAGSENAADELSEEFRTEYAQTIVLLEDVNTELRQALSLLRKSEHLKICVSMFGSGVPTSTSSWYSKINDVCRADAQKLMLQCPNHIVNGLSSDVKEFILACIMLLLKMKVCTDGNLPQPEVNLLLHSALNSIRPKAQQNIGVFKQIEMAVKTIFSVD